MTIRSDAIDALRRGLARRDLRAAAGFGADALTTRAASSRILTSKAYPPGKSWTGRWSWWHQVAPAKLDGDGALILLCEGRSGGFHVLVVPREWFREHRGELSWSASQERFNLFLSAEDGDRFLEGRGAGLDFSRWLVGDLA